ncbi:MAG: signal peptidase I [Pseudomonadota bacterium]|nr:signal peptidase I [Pseudomonadota bacterium]
MQDLSVKHRSPLIAAGMNILAPGLGLYYLGQAREAWLFMLLVILPGFALLLFPWRLNLPLPLIMLPLLSAMLWLLTMRLAWQRARHLSPMIQRQSQRWPNYLLFWLTFLFLSLLWLALALSMKLQLSLHQVKDNSMAGTVNKHDWVVIAADKRRPPALQRGDIVLLIHPETNREVLQRVVASPGEQVTVHGGGLFINGHWQSEYYVDELQNQKRIPEGVVETTVPENQVFVLADNRDHSRDSRYWGALPSDRIVGKQVYRLGDELISVEELSALLQSLSREIVGD